MASARVQRRRRLFRLYAANLSLYAPQVAGVFKCPICESEHGEDSIEGQHLTVDLAHVFPEACGGKPPETLTCKRCNSRIGAKYDSHIARDHEIAKATDGSGRGSLDVRVRFPGGTMGAEIRRTGDHFHFNEIPQQTNPADRDRIFGDMVKGSEVSFDFDFKAPDNQRHAVAMLHSAYLCLFRYFGYEYCVGGNSQWIRDVLMRDDPPEGFAYPTMDVPPGKIVLPERVMFNPVVARLDDGRQLLAVPLPTPVETVITRIVFLPGLGKHAGEVYDEFRRDWAGWASKEHRLQFAAEHHAPEERLSKERHYAYGHHWWRWLCTRLNQRAADPGAAPDAR